MTEPHLPGERTTVWPAQTYVPGAREAMCGTMQGTRVDRQAAGTEVRSVLEKTLERVEENREGPPP